MPKSDYMKYDGRNDEPPYDTEAAPLSCMVNSIVSPEEMLCNELNKVIEAGDTLAEAAHCVQSSYDGIHRLRLALSGWYKTRANENGRANDRNCMECGNAIYQGVLCAECHSKASNRD